MCGVKNLGHRLGALFAGISIVCGIVVYSSPGLAKSILEYLTHSSWQYTILPFEPVRFAIGVVSWSLIGAGIGIAFEKMCECESEKPAQAGGMKRRK